MIAASRPSAQITAAGRCRESAGFGPYSSSGKLDPSGQWNLRIDMKIGRNQQCPCGSGKKFKYCHDGRPGAIMREMSLEARNKATLNAAANIFGFGRGRSWADFKRNITGREIRSFYETQALLWPPETNWIDLIPQADYKLRALYLGEIEPQTIGQNLVRYSLYCDELMVVSPFHNPWHMAAEYNPIENPDQFKSDTIRLIYFLMEVSPWIESGLLKMIPDPGEFYPGLRHETWRLAQKRFGPDALTEDDRDAGFARGRSEMERVVQALPPNSLFRLAEKATGKQLTELEKTELLKHVRRKLREDPLAYERPLTGDGQLNVYRSGANLETALLILNQTGAFPYTNMTTRWNELMSARDQMGETARLWSPLTRAFQSLEFRFLNNVNVEFAENVRQDGRLGTFRALLRRVGKDAKDITDETLINSYVRDCAGELSSEYQRALADWRKIDEGFVKWAGAGIAAGFVTGHVWPDISTLSAAAAATISQLLLRYMRQQQFRRTNPMSVFIDLSKAEPPGKVLY